MLVDKTVDHNITHVYKVCSLLIQETALLPCDKCTWTCGVNTPCAAAATQDVTDNTC